MDTTANNIATPDNNNFKLEKLDLLVFAILLMYLAPSFLPKSASGYCGQKAASVQQNVIK